MSNTHETELFLSNGAKQKLSHLEEMIGCERNTLNSIHSPVHYTEALDCYFRLTRLFNEVDRWYFTTRISAGLAISCASSGVAINVKPLAPLFDQAQTSALSGFLAMATVITLYLTPKLKREENHYQGRLEEEISSLRARLPEPSLK